MAKMIFKKARKKNHGGQINVKIDKLYVEKVQFLNEEIPDLDIYEMFRNDIRKTIAKIEKKFGKKFA
jgi:hypothetical protein